MNAIATPVTGNRWFRTFHWLLRREYWENRGGFLWAPAITGGICVLVALLLAVLGVVQTRGADPALRQVDDTASYMNSVGAAGDALLLAGCTVTAMVLAFVVFFYALGSLYDDRRDRSALFWKSMPVSDAQTVLSKAAWALLLAPLLALAIGLLVGLVLWLVAMVAMAAGGMPHPLAIITHAHPFAVAGRLLASLPLQLLWSLPTVGWLMFCSAFVRSKPFLWAVLVPILACTIVSVLGLVTGLGVPHGLLWYVAVFRGLMSVIPGSWALQGLGIRLDEARDPGEMVLAVLDQANGLEVYGGIDIWIGAAVGAALLAAAVQLRRWRDEA